MRILFLGLTYHEHVEYDIHEWLAQRADAHEYQSTFIRQTADPDLSQFSVYEEPGLINHYWADFGRNMSISPWPPHWKRGLMIAGNLPPRLAFLVKKVREFQPDFIYTSQQHLDCFYALALRRLTGVPHLIHLHYESGPWLGKVALQALRSTPYVISISEFVKQSAIHSGARSEHIRVVYNGLMNEIKGTQRDHAWLCKTFSLPEESRIIVSAGRLDPEKRHDMTIRAMAKVKEVAPEVRLIICGKTYFSTTYEKSLKELTAELGLADHVIFAGHRSDVPHIFASSDIFCLPAINEGFGLVFIEAMNACLPVATVKSGAVPEIVLQEETGLISTPDDVEQLAANLIRLLQDPDEARKLGQAGQERAARLFSGKRFQQDWNCALQDFYHLAALRNPDPV